ncbi:Peptidyl-Lys metalloendopeptidase [Leucoagaricus sp. SymC.cos]|nr:Peptidyl-Lys metalloendopeptidase [Leucoagaricus sp. SymC.cos]
MFTSSVRSTLLALAASAAVVNAAQGISLKVSAPETVDGVENLKITTTMTNTGDETLKLLHDPLGPLSQMPANTFTITGGDKNTSPSFHGIKAKWVPSYAAAQKAYTTLAPGESVNVDHDLFSTYDFTDAGEGAYSFAAHNLFYAVDDSDQITTLAADSEGCTSHVSGKLSAAGAAQVGRRATFNGCSDSQQSDIDSAIPAAQSYASEAKSYISSHTSATSRYTTWFGTYTDARHNTTESLLSHINGNNMTSFTYDCTCAKGDVFAYVYPDNFGHIYLCGAFWRAPNTGTDSKGGTLVHEAAHFIVNGGASDHVYGQDGCKSLATSDPDRAVDNAESYEYFVENNPPLS